MTKIEKLIAKHCPDGVECLPLGELVDICKGAQLNRDSLSDEGSYPVINGGISPSGFWDEFNFEKDLITVSQGGASAGYVNWISTRFWAGAHCFVLMNPKKEVLYRYVYFVVKAAERDLMQSQIGAGIPSVSVAKLASVEIPVPPIPVQEEIVRMLDGMVGLVDALENELNVRRLQYEYYRRRAFEQTDGEIMTLGEVGHVAMCKRILKSQTMETGGVPFYKIGTFGRTADAYISKELFDEYREKFSYPRKGAVLLSAAGTIGRTVVFDGEPAYYQDSNIVWLEHDESKVLDSYLFHWYQMSPWKIPSGGTIERLYNDNILKTQILVPPLSEQKKIVKQLDVFERLCNSTTEGIPGEIAARRRQYEYYREKLLSF